MFHRYLVSTAAILAVWIVVTTADTCKNGGIAGQGVHRKCKCGPGFKGYDCGQEVTPCEARPCRNGGQCSENNDGTFTCKCSALFKGVLCEQRVRPCDSAPCKNGGNCTDDGIKCFKCECPPGFKGPDCREIVQPCEIKPCKNGGECINQKNGRFKCKCRDGYGGTFCDRRDALYSSKILENRIKDVEQLEKWLGGQNTWRLCYRASQNGWASSAFHSRCDNRHPVVVIVRAGRFIFGAYSDVAFGGSSSYRPSSKAFLFSFVNKDNIPPFKARVYRNNGNAVYNNPSYGPTFGGGHDLHISNLASSNRNSYTNFGHTYQPPSGYAYNTNPTKNLLAGSYNFQPNEVEVFTLY